MIGKFCLVRTYSAGVHMGTVAELNGTCCILTDARRLYRWGGAFTLHEVSQNGVSDDSRISQAVPRIYLSEAIEVIPCSEKAMLNLSRSRNGA